MICTGIEVESEETFLYHHIIVGFSLQARVVYPKKLKHFTFQSWSRMSPANSRSELLISTCGFFLVDIHVMVSGSKADF